MQHDLFTQSGIVEARARKGYKTDFPWALGLDCPPLDRTKCEEQAARFVRPLQELLGWKRPEIPTTPVAAPAVTVARAPLRRAPPPPAPTPPSVILKPTARLPGFVSPLVCVKDSAFGRVDCFDQATSAKVWSNWEDGPWRGAEPPPGAPPGSGIGARV